MYGNTEGVFLLFFFFNERELLSWEKLVDAELDLVLLLHAQLYTENKKGQKRANCLWKPPLTSLASILPTLPVEMSPCSHRGAEVDKHLCRGSYGVFLEQFHSGFQQTAPTLPPKEPLPSWLVGTGRFAPARHPSPLSSQQDQNCCPVPFSISTGWVGFGPSSKSWK